jgi:hypothetical protein
MQTNKPIHNDLNSKKEIFPSMYTFRNEETFAVGYGGHLCVVLVVLVVVVVVVVAVVRWVLLLSCMTKRGKG